MAEGLKIDAKRTAVLSMDLQNGIVRAYLQDQTEMVGRAAQVLHAARAAGAMVMHVRVGFRPGLPEVSSRNALFGAVKSSPERLKMFEGDGSEIDSRLGPEAGDIVVTKKRISAFAGSDLAMLLRANEIDTLVMFGVATSGVVLSTLLEASDMDYRLVVVEDCCADREAELHAALMEKLFAQRATVVKAAEVVAALAG